MLATDRQPAAAAQIELGCLEACVIASQEFAACPRPSVFSPEHCAPILECVRTAWPAEVRPRTTVVPPPDGCGLACAALASCRGAPIEAAEQCASQCRDVLSLDLQRDAAGCVELEGCPAIERCVSALPGS